MAHLSILAVIISMRVYLLLILMVLLLLSQGALQAQGLHIKKAQSKIVVDGEMNETDWQEAEVADQFKQYFPFDSSYSKVPTEVRMTYDDHFIYVFAVMHNLGPREYVTPSLRRDFRGEANDAFTVTMDTYKDRTNAFQFGINPFGVQREGLVANGFELCFY